MRGWEGGDWAFLDLPGPFLVSPFTSSPSPGQGKEWWSQAPWNRKHTQPHHVPSCLPGVWRQRGAPRSELTLSLSPSSEGPVPKGLQQEAGGELRRKDSHQDMITHSSWVPPSLQKTRTQHNVIHCMPRELRGDPAWVGWDGVGGVLSLPPGVSPPPPAARAFSQAPWLGPGRDPESTVGSL